MSYNVEQGKTHIILRDNGMVDNNTKTSFTPEKKDKIGVKEGNKIQTSETHLLHDTKNLREQMRTKMENKLTENLGEALNSESSKAVRYGIIGSGHGGSRLAEQFSQFGYPVCVINTSQQDLYHINLPAENKLFMDYSLGGAGKDMDIGGAATQEAEPNIKKMIESIFGNDCEKIDSLVICIGGGGGTGTGSSIPLIQMLSDYNIPITVLYTLPMSSEGTITKSNAINGLDKLAQLSVNKLINGLIIIDNSRIEDLYSDISLGGFFKVANFDIANIFNTFNTLSSLPTQFSAIDPMDFTRIMTSGNCTIYGKVEVPLEFENNQVFMSEEDIANLLLKGLKDGLLAEGFDVSEAIRAGVYITGKSSYLTQIPASTFNYALATLNEEFKRADLFKGIYADERLEDKLVIYTLIGGVGLPRERVEMLKEQAQQDVEEMQEKEKNAQSKMEVFQQTIKREDDKYKLQKKNNSTFGKMVNRRRSRN